MPDVLKNSLLYRIIQGIFGIFSQSILATIFRSIASVYRESRLCKMIWKFLKRDYHYKHTLSYRFIYFIASSIDRFYAFILDKTGTYLTNSILVSSFKRFRLQCKSSLFFHAGYETPLYIAAFFVIIDYIARNLFGSFDLIARGWDKMLLITCILLILYKWLYHRQRKPYMWTPLELPLLFFMSVSSVLLLTNITIFRINSDGFRAVVQNMLWFFVTVQLLKSREGARRFLYLVVTTGTLLSLHGIYQCLTGVSVPAKWIDKAEYSITSRAFSIAGNPNALAAFLILIIPIGIALFYYEKEAKLKFLSLSATSIMSLCLLLTFSRAAWFGFALGIFIFVILKKEYKILVLVALIAIIVAIVMPSTVSRLTYLFSPEYIGSSMTGGRVVRWTTGLMLLKSNWLTGLGFGMFGGAVAANYNISGTFYMDNYFLKLAVESGVIGVGAFIILIYNTLVWILRAIFRPFVGRQSVLIMGILCGMIGLIFHAFNENVFEVPMIVYYFWSLAGVAMYLGRFDEEKKPI